MAKSNSWLAKTPCPASPAEGYARLVTYAGSQAINQSLYAKLPFDSDKDFQTGARSAG